MTRISTYAILVLTVATVLFFVFSEESRLKARWMLNTVIGKETWLATIYPNKEDMGVFREVGHFKSLNECRDAAQKELSRISVAGVYECGLNCETLSKLPGVLFCQETRH